MEVRLSDEEMIVPITVLVDYVAEDAALSPRDRAVLKRWRVELFRPGSDTYVSLLERINARLGKESSSVWLTRGRVA